MEERQEMGEMFGRLAYQAVGELSVKNGWKGGSERTGTEYLEALYKKILSETSPVLEQKLNEVVYGFF